MPKTSAFEPSLVATAIGSLPHADPEEAADLVLSLFDDGPFWPQLPAADWREGMMVQYLEGLPGGRLDDQRQTAVLDIEEALGGMAALDGDYATGTTVGWGVSGEFARGWEPFCRGVAARPTPPRLLKGHVTGPVTLALGLATSFEDRAAIYEPDLARMVARLVGLKARWQEEQFRRLSPSSQTLIFFDEPSLGSLGSAVLNLDADLAVEMLAIAAGACSGLPGVHLCGDTDLAVVMEAGVRVLNFDAYTYLESVVASGPQLRSFVEGGGLLAIGLVPSSLPHPRAVEKESLDSLSDRFDQVVKTLTRTGLDEQQVVRQSFLTPSCGTGGMTPELARRTLELTNQVSARVRKRYESSLGPVAR